NLVTGRRRPDAGMWSLGARARANAWRSDTIRGGIGAVSLPDTSESPRRPQPGTTDAISTVMRKRLPGLDSVRGLAVLVVLAFHITSEFPRSNILHSLFAWGWMGVDLFFALSGFLITGILLNTVGKAGYFRNFYTRRLLRIWPAYLCLLAILT